MELQEALDEIHGTLKVLLEAHISDRERIKELEEITEHLKPM